MPAQSAYLTSAPGTVGLVTLTMGGNDVDFGGVIEWCVLHARKAGFTYVDDYSAFNGHELCSADPYLHGAEISDKVASFHPTAAGQEVLSRLAIAAYGPVTPPMPPPATVHTAFVLDQQQLRRFFGTTSGRKIHYGRVLVEALEPSNVPPPLVCLFDIL